MTVWVITGIPISNLFKIWNTAIKLQLKSVHRAIMTSSVRLFLIVTLVVTPYLTSYTLASSISFQFNDTTTTSYPYSTTTHPHSTTTRPRTTTAYPTTTTRPRTTTTKPHSTTTRQRTTTATNPTTTRPDDTTTSYPYTTTDTTRRRTTTTPFLTTTTNPYDTESVLQIIYQVSDCYQCGMTKFGTVSAKICGSLGCCLTPWNQGGFTPGESDIFKDDYYLGECNNFPLKNRFDEVFMEGEYSSTIIWLIIWLKVSNLLVYKQESQCFIKAQMLWSWTLFPLWHGTVWIFTITTAKCQINSSTMGIT